MSLKFVRVCSDLHLEAFPSLSAAELANVFIPPDERDKESILVLAGDICTGIDRLIDFLAYVENQFLQVHYVPGNHEYYRENMHRWNVIAPARASHILHKTIFNAGGVDETRYFHDDSNAHVRFISATLWGDGGKSLFERAMVGRYLNDFQLIHLHVDPNSSAGFKAEREFRVSDMMEINKQHRDGIYEALEKPWAGKTIVVTHHLPSYLLCHPRFGAEANGGFASDCENMIFTFKPDVWIHGHTHDTIDDVMGSTRIVCNPAGYRGEWTTEYNTFSPKFIEL